MAKYSDIKGFTVQTLSSDPVANKYAGGAWTSGGSLPQALYENAGAGATQTAALNFGGQGNPPGPAHPTSAETQTYDGSSWTEVNDLNNSRRLLGGAGTTTSAIAMGGYTQPPGADGTQFHVELWDGTNWTETTNLNTKGRYFQGFGVLNTAAVVANRNNGSSVTNKTETWNGSAWTEVAESNTNRSRYGAAGTSTAGVIAGGSTPAPSDTSTAVEQWNGSAWTEIAEINTGRNTLGGSGAYTDALMSGGDPGSSGKTERYDGSSWTELSDLSTGRYLTGSAGHTAADTGIVFGGYDGSARTTATEEFSAPAVFTKQIEGQLFFNSTANTFKETISDVPGTSWSSGTNLNQARSFNNAAGSIPSAITFGGSPAPTQAYAEQWNGSAWTEVADLNEGRVGGAGGGASGTDAIMAGGYELPNVGNSVNTEIWDGSSWTEVNNLNAQKYTAGSAIPVSTSGFAFGGNPSVATAEVWDGTNWTEVSDLNTARMYLAGFGSATSAIAGNGIDPSASPPTYLQNKVEKWDGSSWTEVAEYNTARVENLQGQGSSNAAGIVAGGGTTGSNQIANTEIWNGTSWTEANDLATARRMGGQIGSTTNGMYVGGNSGSDYSTTVEHWESGLANKTITAS